jgi:excinuclease ABC subunit C
MINAVKSTKKHKKEDRTVYLKHIISKLPSKPGVYKMKDASGGILYIGKAKDLKKRVSNYFQNNKKNAKTKKLVEQIEDIDFIAVDSELEALILETNLIKEVRPKYNILMKDDKNYVYIKITVNEDYPRIFITRKLEKDKAKYFGPKTAQHKAEKTLTVLKKIFPFRHCSLLIDYVRPGKVNVRNATIKYPCLDYHIKRCIGPCLGNVSKEEYRKIVDQIIRFLEGKHDEIITKLKEDMAAAVKDKKFESAAKIRDKLMAVEEILERQKVVDTHQENLDVINYFNKEGQIFFNLFQIRNGRLLNQDNFIFKTEVLHEEDPDTLMSFFEQYYEKATDIPKEILIPHDIEGKSTIEKWLSDMKGQKIKILVPKKGRKDKLLELAYSNAKHFSGLSEAKWEGKEKKGREEALQNLMEILKLDKAPRRIECFDVSHLSGTGTVSSMIVFENGFPKKSDYRKFKLHQEKSGSPDDYASMEETLDRRFKYLKPSAANQELKLKKITKKEFPQMLKIQKLKKIDNKDYLAIELNKKICGFVHFIEAADKKLLILLIHFYEEKSNVETRLLLKKICEKLRTKRLYLHEKSFSNEILERSGCQFINKIPDSFKLKKDEKLLVFDKTKQKDDSSFTKIPDLIIIDGGKGQLNVAVRLLKKICLKIPVVSIAKREEELFIPGKSDSIKLSKDNPVLHLIQHSRDEAHRFAVSFQQNVHLKNVKSSILDEIPGIGEGIKQKLLLKFGAPENLRSATLYEIASVAGKKNAIKIKEKLKG